MDHRSGPGRGGSAALAFPTVNRFSIAFFLWALNSQTCGPGRDIGRGINSTAERALLLGGEVSAWTDDYVYPAECDAFVGFVPGLRVGLAPTLWSWPVWG